MLTLSEIREKTFKSGLGYDKKDVDKFIKEISDSFEQLLSENYSLKEQLSYYKSIEKTLQRALVIAEKTAQDIKDNAVKEAEAIELNAKANAKLIESQAIKQSEIMEHKTLNLIKQYDLFKAHYKNLLNAQLELLNSESFSINTVDFSYKDQLNDELSDQKELKNDHEAETQNEDAFEYIDIDDEI